MDAIKSFFSEKILSEPDHTANEHGLHLATAAILLEVSLADFEMSEEDLSVVAGALGDQFSLTEEETQALLKLAIREHDLQHSLYPFLRLINDHFSLQQRWSFLSLNP